MNKEERKKNETIETIESLLKEKRIFKPPKEFVKNSNIALFMKKHGIKNYDELLKKARKKPEWFWKEMAEEVGISWQKKPKKILEWKWPYAKWFVGAKYNIVLDALDKQVKERPDKIAYIWEGERGEKNGEIRKITYKELYEETCKFANVLKELGIKKGDRVAIWLPIIPELPIAMLATAKIGAIHSVVFSGFSENALAERINDAGAKILITADGYLRNGQIVELKNKADSILDKTQIKKVIVVKRIGEEIKTNMKNGRDFWWHEIVAKQKAECKTKIMDANDILFILYTSGTTGKPKGIIHCHAGYAVGISTTMKFVFDVKENDIWWCTADIGWITGHSYAVYAPLMLGLTSILYEGSPTWPNPSRWWEIIDKYKVTIFYTAPTAIRMFMKFGEEWVKPYKLDSLRLLGSVGEPINPEAWVWYWKNIGKGKCPIMDTWWQTETGMFVITPVPTVSLKPGSAFKPFPSIEADVFDEKGKSLKGKNVGGYLVLKTPWPAMLHGIWKNPERYFETYWEKFKAKKVYLTGDAARIDKDGYFWLQGRIDDVIKVAGHRIGNAEVESSLVSHNAVSEAAVVGKPHEIKGEVIVAFVVLKKDIEASKKLEEELKEWVAKQISKIAKPEIIYFVSDLPKTRSGKIMRRVIKAILLNQELGDISTLANPESIEEVKKAIEKQ